MAQGQYHGADKEFLEVYRSVDELLLAKRVNLKYIPYEEQLRIGNVLDVPDNALGMDCIGLGSALGMNTSIARIIAHRNRETGATIAIFNTASKNQKSYFDVYRFLFDKNIDGTDRLLRAWPAVKEGYMEHEGVPRRGELQQEAMMEGVQDSWNCPEANLFSHNDSATEIKSAIGRNLGRTGHEITGCHGSSGRYGDGRVHSYNICHGPNGTGCYGNSDYDGCRPSYSRREYLAPRCVNQHGDLPQAPPTSEQSMSINNLSLKEDKESVVSCSDNCQVPLLPPVSLAAPPTNRDSSAPLGPWDLLQSVERDSDTESGISVLDRCTFQDTLPKPSSRYVEDVVEPNVRQWVANLDVGGFRACGRSQVGNPRNAIGERKTPAVSYIPNITQAEIELAARLGEVDKISNNNNGQRNDFSYEPITNDGHGTNVNGGQRPKINGEQMADISNGQRTRTNNVNDEQRTNVNDDPRTNDEQGQRPNNGQLTNIPTTVTECLSSDIDSETGRAPLLATPPSSDIDSETGRAPLLATPQSLRDCETGRTPLLSAHGSWRDCITERDPLLSAYGSWRDRDDGYPSDNDSDPGPSSSQVGIPVPPFDLGRGSVLPRVVEGVFRWNEGTPREEGELREVLVPRMEERAVTDPTKFMFVMCPAKDQEDAMMAELVKYLVCSQIAFVIDLLGGLLYSNEMTIADSNAEIVGQNRKIYKELFDKAQLVLIVKDDNRERSNHGYQNRVNNIISWAREENRLKRRTERIVFIHSNNMNVTKNLTKIKKRFHRNES